MAASILFACGLNDKDLLPYVHISEETNVDASFLISAVLGQRLRISNAGALLICLQHNYAHYFHAGLRLGYNTNIFLNKTLNIVDPMNDMSENFQANKWLDNERTLTKNLLECIRGQLDENFQNRNSITILIDNLSILYNLGATKEEVQQLCQALAALTKEYANLTVITKMNNCDIYAAPDANVNKLAALRIRAIKLKSGQFREVDGKLVIERDVQQGSFENTEALKEILFKVNDRNVKIFTPGEVGVKTT